MKPGMVQFTGVSLGRWPDRRAATGRATRTVNDRPPKIRLVEPIQSCRPLTRPGANRQGTMSWYTCGGATGGKAVSDEEDAYQQVHPDIQQLEKQIGRTLSYPSAAVDAEIAERVARRISFREAVRIKDQRRNPFAERAAARRREARERDDE